MKQDRQITQSDLHAYVDQQLADERLEAVETWLRDHPKERANVRRWQRQNDALLRAFDKKHFTQIPSRLDVTRLKARQRPVYQSIAASLLLLVVGGLIGWFAHAPLQTQTASFDFTRPAIAAFRVYTAEVRHPVEVGADQASHLIKWLSKRLDYPLKIPRLDSLGYELIGGRLLAISEGPAAQLMFEDLAGNRITLFATQSPGKQETAFHFSRDRDISAFYWIDDAIGYAIIGKTDRQSLLRIAHLVYAQLNGLHTPAQPLPAAPEKAPRPSAT